MLSSSVVSVISADDLTSVASNLQSQTFRSFEIYIVVAAIYLALALSFSTCSGRLPARLQLPRPALSASHAHLRPRRLPASSSRRRAGRWRCR